MNQNLKDYGTFIIAVIGAALGIINFIIDRRRNRELIRVIPKSIVKRYINAATNSPIYIVSDEDINDQNIDELFAIEVTNFSSFKVRIDSVGFIGKNAPNLFTIITPIIDNGNGKLPIMLEPRDSVTIYSNTSELARICDAKITCAYAKTSTDSIYKGNSKALQRIVQHFLKQRNLRKRAL